MAITVTSVLVILFTFLQSGLAIFYNSSTACFRGSEQNQFYTATCDQNTTNEVGIIAVNRVFYGAQPTAQLCQITDPKSVCCTYTPDQDCFFANKAGQLPADVVAGCSGNTACQVTGKKKYAPTNCSPSSQFSSFTTYGFMEYQCINVGRISDICHDGIINNGEELYIDSNFYHNNVEHSDKTCSCKVTTSCGAKVIFSAVDIRLHKVTGTNNCKEEMFLVDNKNTSVNNTLTCLDRDLNAFTEIFTSLSNTATLSMTITGNHTGKVWVKIKSSWPNATVQLHCGATKDLPTNSDHQCPEDVSTTSTSTSTTTTPTTTVTTTTSTTTSTTTTSPTSTPTSEDLSSVLDLPTGAIAGIVVAGVLILFIIIVILILVFRRHKKQDNHPYEVPTQPNPGYESLHYTNPSYKPPLQENGFNNPGYGHEKYPEGDTPQYDTIDSGALAQYDNVSNDDIMVMPKGAVM